MMFKPLVLLLLCYAFTEINCHECIHDKMMKHSQLIHQVVPQNYSVDTGLKRAVGNPQPIRIVFDKQNFGSAADSSNQGFRTCGSASSTVIITQKKNGAPSQQCSYSSGITDECLYICQLEDVLTTQKQSYLEKLLGDAVLFWSLALQLDQISGQLVLPFGTDCGIDGPILVGNNYAQSNADLVLFITARPIVTPGVLGFGGDCRIADQSGRPISGQLNINPASLDVTGDKDTEQLYTVIHEIAHVLGFNEEQFNTKRMTIQSNQREHVVTLINTPNVLKEAREYFACDTLDGVELENQGGYGTSISHWEKRIFMNEVMTGQSSNRPVLSRITLALFNDLQWYVADYSVADGNTLWGRNQGCPWVQDYCSNSWDRSYFCNYPDLEGCDGDVVAKSICKIDTNGGTGVPSYYKYFASPFSNAVGSIELADFCPVFIPYSNGDCLLQTSNHIEPIYGEKYGPNSRCFLSTVGSIQQKKERPVCYETKCISNSDMWVVISSVSYYCGGAGSEITVSGSGIEGTLTCPDPFKVCYASSSSASISEPLLKSVKPDQGAAGTSITISGSHLQQTESVSVGPYSCGSLNIASDTSLSCELEGPIQTSRKQPILITSGDGVYGGSVSFSVVSKDDEPGFFDKLFGNNANPSKLPIFHLVVLFSVFLVLL